LSEENAQEKSTKQKQKQRLIVYHPNGDTTYTTDWTKEFDLAEVVYLGDYVLIVDENAKLRNEPINPTATAICIIYGRDAIIAGKAIHMHRDMLYEDILND